MAQKTSVYLPPHFMLQALVSNNPVLQLRRGEVSGQRDVVPFTNQSGHGQMVFLDNGEKILVTPKATKLPNDVSAVLIAPEGTAPASRQAYIDAARKIRWVTPAPLTTIS